MSNLSSFRPRLSEAQIECLHGQVVAAVSRTDFVTDLTDRTRLSVLYRYGAWVLDREGAFGVATMLDDDRLHSYRLEGCTTLRPSSKDTAFSVLRSIRNQTPFKDGTLMSRNPVTAPYGEFEWRNFVRVVDGLVRNSWHTDAQTLLDLSGGLLHE